MIPAAICAGLMVAAILRECGFSLCSALGAGVVGSVALAASGVLR